MKKLILITIFTLFAMVFNMLNAQIVSVTPDHAIQGEMLDIEVTAENINFTQGTNIVYLKNGSTEFIVSQSYAKSPTILTFNYTFTSDKPIGYYDLRIWNSSKTLTKTNAIFVTPDLTIASLDSIVPDTASQGENVTITLYGTNTNFEKAGVNNSVYLRNGYSQIFAIATNPVDSVTLEARFYFDYSYPVGLYSISVNNTSDGEITIPNAFGLLKGPNLPAILSVNPDTVTQGETLDIEVTGENTDFTQGTNVVYFEQGNTVFYTSYPTITSATSLTINQSFNIDFPVGYYNLSIRNTAANITLTKNNAIYVKPDLTGASIDSITPKTALQGEKIIMTVYGRNTNFNKAGLINSVYLKNGYRQINAKTTNPIDSLTLEAEFELTYAHTIGFYSINVNNFKDGTVTIPDAFRLSAGINAPAILSVTPDTLDADKTLDLDIEVTAENIDFTQGTNVVSLMQGNTVIFMNYSSANSPTSLSANFTLNNSVPPGNYNLSIWNTSFDIMLVADQTLVKEKAFYLKSSVIIKLNITRDDKTYFYPNPVNDVLYLKQKYELTQLFDLKGRKILEAKHEDVINVSELLKGMYLIKLKKGNAFIVKKLIVE